MAEDGARSCVDPEKYEQYEAAGALVDRGASMEDTQGPAPVSRGAEYPINSEEGAD